MFWACSIKKMINKNNFGNFTINRVEAFSDGVFAIVVTILVFDLKFPQITHPTNANVWAAIVAILPKMLAWMNSFLVVCVIWMNHHRFMATIKIFDTTLFWLNNLLLMFTSLIPFPTELLGEYVGNNSATFFYGICLSLPTVLFSAIGKYISRNRQLLKVDFNESVFRRTAKLRGIFGPLAYWVGAATSWVNVWVAAAIYTAISIYFIFSRIRLSD